MATASDALGHVIGKHTVAENLRAAVARGSLLQNEDGSYALPPAPPGASAWLRVTQGPPLSCRFLMDFLFDNAYARAAVPNGCQSCYKVAVTPKNLVQLMALHAVQEELGIKAKCGIEVDRETTQNLYSGFFYCDGLEHARQVYWQVRAALDRHPRLGPEVPLRIKRGCTEYEIHCGPSDRFEFSPELAAVEAELRTRFKHVPGNRVDKVRAKLATLSHWLKTAYRIGDDSYLEFTGGKPLYPASVTYDPSVPSAGDG